MYDLKIRKAFALSEIPDMERTSADYGKQILNICNILFKEDFYTERLKPFEKKILLSFTIEEKENLEEELRQLLSKKDLKMSQKYRFIAVLWAFASIMLLGTLVAVFLARRPFDSLPRIGDNDIFGVLLEAGSFITVAFIFFLGYIKNPDYYTKGDVIDGIRKKISEMDKKIEEIEKSIV